MSWLSRLFGGTPEPPPPPPPPPANQVIIPQDIATAIAPLETDDLETAVATALRAHLDRLANDAALRGERLPFWLRRDSDETGDLSDQLRDKVTQRRANEAER